jgi:hypothetical protein
MVLTRIEYAKDDNGNKLPISANDYADHLARDIYKEGITCPDPEHQGRINATAVLGIDGKDANSLVVLLAVEEACCPKMIEYLHENLKKIMNF